MNLALIPWLLLAAIACGGAGYWRGHSSGEVDGAAKVQKEWDHAVELSKVRHDKDADVGRAQDDLVTNVISEIDKRYGRTPLTKALQQRVDCPKSGKVGDVVLPAAVIDSLFNRDAASSTSNPASAPSR